MSDPWWFMSRRPNSDAPEIKEGDVFGEWTVVKPPLGKKVPCRCSCGDLHLVFASGLRDGRSTKCRRCADRLRRKPKESEPA